MVRKKPPVTSIEDETILCITISYWDEPKRSRHHLMRVLSEKNKVVWVEKAISFAELSFKNLPKFFQFTKPTRQVKKNLWVITPPPAIPFFDKLPWLEYINDYILLKFIKSSLKKIGLIPGILWVFSYYGDFFVGKFDEKVSLYYCSDPFGAWDKTRRVLREEKLCRKVDLVITSHLPLTREKKAFNRNCRTVFHGVDTKIYKESLAGKSPPDILNIPRPIIGYTGPVRDLVDIELLQYLAQKRPGWSIVLVGPMVEMNKAQTQKWQELKEPNIYLLKGREPHLLAYCLRRFEVAVFPYYTDFFKQYPYCKVPLKYFEYLMMGKPIVSTAYSDYEGITGEFHELASTHQEFLQKVEKCMKENSLEKQRKRMEFARRNSWQKRIEEIKSYLQETLALKGG